MSWEVRIMQSKTSCFNGAVYRKTLSRWWPLWAIIAIILFFWLPFSMANAKMNGGYEGNVLPPPVVYNLALEAVMGLPLLTCLFGLFTAGATFDYLFKKRSAGMMAVLPLRREGLFCSSALAGLTMLLTPGVVMAVIAAIFSRTNGQPDLTPVLTWLGAYSAEAVTFYGVGVFCAMLTGQVLVLPCLYVLVNFGGVLLCNLLHFMARLLLVGVPQNRTLGALEWLVSLSPASKLLQDVGVTFSDHLGKYANAAFSGWSTILIYLAVGVALLFLALVLFKRRKMECAQEPVSVRWLGPVLKYIVTFYCALGLPAFLAVFFGGRWTTTAVGLVAFVVLGALIGYLISEMILRKSVRVLKKSWRGLLITAAAAIAVVGMMKLDVFGYVHHLPEPDEIESADVRLWMNVTANGLSDPKKLETLTALHRDLIDKQEPNIYGINELTIVYHLKNGGTLERAYEIPATDEGQDLYVRLYELLNGSGVRDDSRDPRREITAEVIRYASVSWTEPEPNQSPDEGVYKGAYVDRHLTADAALDLMRNGILPDLEAGAFPLINEPSEAYLPSYPCVDMELYWQEDGSQPLHYDITPDCTHALAWLAAHGYEIPGID